MNATAFRVLVVALVVYFALAAFPPGPLPASSGLDPSWVAGLNMAHVQGLVAGKDWVFTLGPLGFPRIADRPYKENIYERDRWR